AERYRLGRDDMHEWTTLNARKQFAIDLLCVFLLAKNQTPAWSAESFMCGCRYVISVWHWRWMKPGGNRTGDVCNVSEHTGTNTSRNLTDAFEVNNSWIGRSAAHYQFRFVLLGESL